MSLRIPDLCLVVLIGASGSGAFARKHFKMTEVISSDACRGFVPDDENDQRATQDAFEVLHFLAAKRLARGHLTVIDAINVQPEARKPLVDLARHYHCFPLANLLDMDEARCGERNLGRPDRSFGDQVIRNQRIQLHSSMRHLESEGFRYVHVLRRLEDVEACAIERQSLWNNRKGKRGPFNVIGDVHGWYDELVTLLTQLGYKRVDKRFISPEGRKAIFLGDLVDRGPARPQVVRLVRAMVTAGDALCVAGNHDVKLVKALNGRKVSFSTNWLNPCHNSSRNNSRRAKRLRRSWTDWWATTYSMKAGW